MNLQIQSMRRNAVFVVVAVVAAALLVSCAGTTPKVEPDTKPSFGTKNIPAIQPLPVRVALSIPVQLPEASGGEGDLTYTLVPIPPGLSFDPTSRVVSGEPTQAGVFSMTYTAADEDGDVATLASTITVIHTMVFWVDIQEMSISSARLDDLSVTELVTFSDGGEPHDIALDVPGNKMYWTELAPGKVRRANLDGSDVEDLVSSVPLGPRSIALDVSGGKMYWTDQDTNSIRRANLDGSGVEDFVTGLSSATAIALDPIGGMIYWIDDGADVIQRANLDGTGVEDIVMSGLAYPHGLAVDPVNGKLYWAHHRTGVITRANLDGTEIEDIVADGLAGQAREMALDLINQQIYWTTWTDQAGGEVRRANADGSGIETLASGYPEPYGIALH